MKIEISHSESVLVLDALVARIHELRRLSMEEDGEAAAGLEVMTVALYERLRKDMLSAQAREMAEAYAEDEPASKGDNITNDEYWDQFRGSES